jgi:magnesium and cobalt transporter
MSSLNFFSSLIEPVRKRSSELVHRFLRKVLPIRVRNARDMQETLHKVATQGLFPEEMLKIMERTVLSADKRVRDIMVSRTQMASLKKDETLENWVKEIVKTKHSRYPIVDSKLQVTGILLVKDLLTDIRDKSELDSKRIEELKHPPHKVPESKTLYDLMNDLRRQRIHMAIVVDQHGDTAGVVTLEDAIEEFVGEIEDEHDLEDEGMITESGKNTWTVDALTPISDFNRKFHVKIRDTSVETIGGWMTVKLEHVPKQGDTCEISEYTLEVIRAEKRRAQELRVSKKLKRSRSA